MRTPKQKPDHYWNHRVITKLHTFDYREPERTFSVVEVHYENGLPVAYGGKKMLQHHDSVKALKWTTNKIKAALSKPVLDADNWPSEWNES